MLQENFPDLTQLYGQGPLAGYMGGQQIDQARKSQQINQQGAIQDMYQKEQMLPVDMANRQAQANNYNASSTRMGEETKKLSRENKMKDATYEQDYQAELKRLAREATEDDLKSMKAETEGLLYHPEANVRELGQYFVKFSKDVIAEREKQNNMAARQLEVEEARGANQRATIAARPAAGSALKPMTLSQWEASLRQKALEGDETAMQALAQLEEDKRLKAAAGALVGDSRTRELLGTEKTGPDRSSTGKTTEKQVTPGNYEKGKQYKGRTGTYEYIGGDPADKASWKKVD